MSRVRIAFFGGVDILSVDGRRFRVPSRSALGLIGYLSVRRGQPQSRTRVASLLWDHVDFGHARGSLRQTLFTIRRALGREIFRSEDDSLALDPRAVRADLWDFEDLIALGTADSLMRAAEFYQGDFMEGVRPGKSLAFEEWLSSEQNRLRDQVLHALWRVLDHAVAADAVETARAAASRMLAIDRAEESAHRALMRIHANERHFGLALRQYELCRKALEADLGVEPDGETRSLYAEIVRRRSSAGPATRVAVGPALPLGQVA